MSATLARKLAAQLLRGIGRGRGYAPLRMLYACVPASWRDRLRRWLMREAGGARLSSVTVPEASPQPRLPAALGLSPSAPTSGAGVNLYGYVQGEFGLGENVRAYARALLAAGYPIRLLDADAPSPGRMLDRSLAAWVSNEAVFPVNLCFVNPDRFAEMAPRTTDPAFGERYTIGFWLWELDRAPEAWRPALDLVDEIWVPTAFVQSAFRRMADKPVVRVPKAIAFEIPQGIGRRDFGLQDGCFIFLFSFDFHSYFARKNPLAVIAAFRAAFPRGRDDVRLVIKSVNGDRLPDQYALLAAEAARDPRIICHDGFLSREAMFALLASTDTYVSLHRSEGFGLGLAESMYLGKPVVATGYSGNLDFMNAGNSCLVGYRMVDVGPGEYPAAAGQQWAEPDVEDAAACMRRLADDPAAARALGAVAARQVREQLSPKRCAEAAIARLQEITSGRPTDVVGRKAAR